MTPRETITDSRMIDTPCREKLADSTEAATGIKRDEDSTLKCTWAGLSILRIGIWTVPHKVPNPLHLSAIEPVSRRHRLDNHFHGYCLSVNCTISIILSRSDQEGVVDGAQSTISVRQLKSAAQTSPTQPRSLPGLSRPAGSWAVLAATWLGSTTPAPPSSTLSTWGSALPAP